MELPSLLAYYGTPFFVSQLSTIRIIQPVSFLLAIMRLSNYTSAILSARVKLFAAIVRSRLCCHTLRASYVRALCFLLLPEAPHRPSRNAPSCWIAPPVLFMRLAGLHHGASGLIAIPVDTRYSTPARSFHNLKRPLASDVRVVDRCCCLLYRISEIVDIRVTYDPHAG